MKDRQAELEKNVVAENLTSFFKKIEPYSKLILAGVVAVVVALIGIGLYSSGESAKRSDSTYLLLMEDPEVDEKFPGTNAAGWSLVFQANTNLATGINALYTDRDEAETLLSDAKDQYQGALSVSKDQLLVSRASYGQGLAHESLGEIDEAIASYQATIDADESEQMVEVAQERIDRLSRPQSKEFLAWFGEQDFSPADPSLPPEMPGVDALPDAPDMSLPGLDLGDGLGASDEPITGGLNLPEMEEGEENDGEESGEESPTESDEEDADAPAETDADAPAADENDDQASAE